MPYASSRRCCQDDKRSLRELSFATLMEANFDGSQNNPVGVVVGP
jgi:hypothetical protein